MFYHFLAPEGGHPTWQENSTEKNTRMQGPFFWATPENYINKSNEMLFQKVQQRCTRPKNTIFFQVLLLTNHETPNNLKILCLASTHLLSQSLPFLQLQVCDHFPIISLWGFFQTLKGR